MLARAYYSRPVDYFDDTDLIESMQDVTHRRKRICRPCLEQYKGNLLLVGINYNKKAKGHECKIEKFVHKG